ncbi:MAG: hypothetical protein JWO32_1327 [Bacteroidetes bacterium]|nr:hypothetical protein [Bacteroidota bacterium]
MFLSLMFVAQNKDALSYKIFSSLKYDKVICYECDITKQGFIVMNGSDGVNPKIIKKSRIMNKAQTDTFHSKFLNKTLQSSAKFTKESFYQNLAVVYYPDNKIVAYFDIPR